MTRMLGVCVALALGGCASYSGSSLVAGASNAAQVESVMGRPAMRVANPDGSSVLYYPRQPLGRHNYAVTLGPDGVLRSIDQRLTHANIDKLRSGRTTIKEVRELFGPADPSNMSWLPLMQRDSWEYKWLDVDDKRILIVQFSADGVLREVMNSHDHGADEPSGPGGATMP